MPRYSGINHLAMITGDLDRTIRFWRDLLGMRIIAALGRPGYRQYFFEISEHDTIAFFEWPDVEPLPEKDHGAPVKGAVGFDHVAIGVARQEDLWDLKDRLESAGFWASEVVDHGFMQSLYSFDPNNIPVEFSFSTRGDEIRRNPLMKDHEPSKIAREGPEPNPNAWPAVMIPTAPEERIVYPGEGSELFHGRQNEK